MKHPPKLVGGPYLPPIVKKGDELEDVADGAFYRVGGYAGGEISWPKRQRSGTPSLIVTAELAEAIRTESSLAIQYYWGVSADTVARWRRKLGVDPLTPGTRQLHVDLAPIRLNEKAVQNRNATKRTAEGRRRNSESHLGQKLSEEHKEKLARAGREAWKNRDKSHISSMAKTVNARPYHLKGPDGSEHHGQNLAEFVRTMRTAGLFDFCSENTARACLNRLRPKMKNRATAWHGWTWIETSESEPETLRPEPVSANPAKYNALIAAYGKKNTKQLFNAAIRAEIPGGARLLDLQHFVVGVQSRSTEQEIHDLSIDYMLDRLTAARDTMVEEIQRRYGMRTVDIEYCGQGSAIARKMPGGMVLEQLKDEIVSWDIDNMQGDVNGDIRMIYSQIVGEITRIILDMRDQYNQFRPSFWRSEW